jgi:hypothetical protein
MKTFDQVLPQIREVLSAQNKTDLDSIGHLIINRDLNGRVRLIVADSFKENESSLITLQSIVQALLIRLEGRTYPFERAVIFERDLDRIKRDTPCFPLEGFENIFVIDRLVTEGNWADIAPVATGAPRIVFFSIKGGVGRSTALAASAWAFAQMGKKVLVLDLDLESPGLSSSLLPVGRRPEFGIADWLVEDLLGNGDEVLDDLVATSPLSHDGEIYVVPAHGRDPGEYVSKLGRVWMSKVDDSGQKQTWSHRLNKLIDALEQKLRPDVLLIDSRAGIDEVASSCVADLGAGLILLFSIDGEQTWSGYQILFHHWRKSGAAREIRERLQIVGSMIPELGAAGYFSSLCEHAYDLFTDELYDEIPAGGVLGDFWSFDKDDSGAPHYPWVIKWHRSFAALHSLHSRFDAIDSEEVFSIFGSLVEGLKRATSREESSHE